MENSLRTLAALALFALCTLAYAIPPIQHWQTASGAQVYFVENHDLPMFDLSVDFPAGAAYDTLEKSGVARMTNHVMRLGTGDMDENEIARRLADVGALLGGRFDADRAGITLRSLSGKTERGQALKVVASLLQRPIFPASIIDREKARAVDMIRESDTKPETIASRNFFRMVYRGHPYGLRDAGEADTVARLTRDDLLAFYRSHYAAPYAVVALMGDLTREEANAMAEDITAGLPPAAGAEPVLPPVPQLTHSDTRWFQHPATQSHILIGAPSIARTDPDYFPLLVGNYVLGGGGFVSRLMDEVRQKRGLAYSAYSYFAALRHKGPFVIGMQTRRDQTPEALAVVRKTLDDFLKHGPTDKELTAAKQNLVGGFPLRIDSNRKIQEYLALIGFYHLPLTYLDDFVKNVERVTAADVRSAFARHIDATRLVTVVVGPNEDKTAAADAAQ